MTPESKAEQLSFYYENLLEPYIVDKEILLKKSRQCAKIAADEVLGTLFQHHEIDFWKEVKEKLLKPKL